MKPNKDIIATIVATIATVTLFTFGTPRWNILGVFIGALFVFWIVYGLVRSEIIYRRWKSLNKRKDKHINENLKH